MDQNFSSEEEALLPFVGWWATRMWSVDPQDDAHPVLVYRRGRQSGASTKLMLAGLRQAARDCVSAAADLPASKIREIDRELQAAGLRTLTSFRAEFTRSLGRILKEGRLRDEEDYYLVTNILDDSAVAVSAQDRDALVVMMASWEESCGPGESSA